MRWTVWTLVAVAAMAGCLDGSDEDADTPIVEQENMGEPPAPIHEEGAMMAIGDFGGAGLPSCGIDGQACADFPFTLDGAWTAQATLSMTNGAVADATQGQADTDYDLYLLDGDGNVLAESTNPGPDEDAVSKKLEAGDYMVRVQAWHDIDGSYTLDVLFS